MKRKVKKSPLYLFLLASAVSLRSLKLTRQLSNRTGNSDTLVTSRENTLLRIIMNTRIYCVSFWCLREVFLLFAYIFLRFRNLYLPGITRPIRPRGAHLQFKSMPTAPLYLCILAIYAVVFWKSRCLKDSWGEVTLHCVADVSAGPQECN